MNIILIVVGIFIALSIGIFGVLAFAAKRRRQMGDDGMQDPALIAAESTGSFINTPDSGARSVIPPASTGVPTLRLEALPAAGAAGAVIDAAAVSAGGSADIDNGPTGNGTPAPGA